MQIIEILRTLLRPFKRRCVAACYRGLLLLPSGPGLYYWIFCSAFATEHRISLLAKLDHLRTGAGASRKTSNQKVLEYRLRRNIHRLEKGLIMVPRRPVFALDYICETAEIFKQLFDGKIITEDSCNQTRLAKWANDVLANYFAVVESHSIIESARGKFVGTRLICGVESSIRYVPSPLVANEGIPTIEQFDSLSCARKSVRWYQDRRVSREMLDRAVEIAGRSPSACNRQPYRFVIFDDPSDAAIVGSVPKGTAGFSDKFPCVIVVVGNIGAYFSERDRHVIYIDAALASMSLQFALVSMGLGCCCINWPDIHSQDVQLKEYVALDETERVVMLISVGFPRQDALVPFSAKKEIELLRQYETLAGHHGEGK